MNERSAKLFLRPRILFIYNNFKKSTVENQSNPNRLHMNSFRPFFSRENITLRTYKTTVAA